MVLPFADHYMSVLFGGFLSDTQLFFVFAFFFSKKREKKLTDSLDKGKILIVEVDVKTSL